MVRADTEKWGQTSADLLRMSMEAEHARSRERYLAIYMIESEQANATTWASQIGRDDNTVLNWLHRYNQFGPEALQYRKTGGRPPFLAKNRLLSLS